MAVNNSARGTQINSQNGTPAAQNIPMQQTSASGAALRGDLSQVASSLVNKNFNDSLRMVVEIPSLGKVFKAHIDPNHYQHTQGKRMIPIDVLTGVIEQDFGYLAETVEIHGNTGLQFYNEIATMNDIFNNQLGGMATTVNLKIEDISVTASWTNFEYRRTANAGSPQVVDYTMQFIVLSHTPSADAGVSNPVAQQMKANNTTASTSTRSITLGGQSVNSYLSGILSNQSYTYYNVALQFMQSNFNSSANSGMSFPNPDATFTSSNSPSFVVPSDWSTFFVSNPTYGQ